MNRKTPGWEAELWSYLSMGDGTHCPLYQSCQLRLNNAWCLSEHKEYCELISHFVDDDLNFPDQTSFKSEILQCPKSGRIFELVRRLANRYLIEAGINHLPIPTDLITQADDNLPIEVRQVPLKACHGAVWRLNDCWLVQLNNNDTTARQRFTLYHEIFHILAHCEATPVFKKTLCSHEGYFNELLADHFAGFILLPYKWVLEKWTEVKDSSQMAAIFDVPQSVAWFTLKHINLI